MRFFLLYILASLLPLSLPAAERDSVATALVERLSHNVAVDDVSGVEGVVYIRQKVEVEKKNLFVNHFPDMTRFDKDENSYLSEYLYNLSSLYGKLPEMQLLSSQTTHRRGKGEMDRVLSFMTPMFYGERLFNGEFLSPLYSANIKYYDYAYCESHVAPGETLVEFTSGYDNIQLFSKGSILVSDADELPLRLVLEGWDEQCRFVVTLFMGQRPGHRCLVDSIDLSIDYGFLGNRMDITANGVFSCTNVVRHSDVKTPHDRYDITARHIGTAHLYAMKNVPMDSLRLRPLCTSDSLFYASKVALRKSAPTNSSLAVVDDEFRIRRLLWRVGDEAFSSHTVAWGESDLRFSPLVNPSCLSYSSSRGLAYRFSLNFRLRMRAGQVFTVRPMVGYSFKHKEFYWSVRSVLPFAPMHRGRLSLDVGRGSSVYSSAFLDLIKDSPLDSLRFDELPLIYYRDFHLKLDASIEPVNGLEVMLGANFYKRSLYGDAVDDTAGDDAPKRRYRQFAPHARITWQPGMYYYISNGRKVNVGSLAPCFSLDVEQGVSGLFGSHGVYTRAELDVQRKYHLSPGASLYLRAGTGGYFYTKDVFFVDYAFLKDNLLALDKEDELSGVFQLLDREWYNAAKKYVRLNASYESPLLLLQRIAPRVSFIKNETLYAGMLFISHLCPYWECGYGVETPYINVGLFAGFEKASFHKIGFKVTISLFNE